MLLIDHGQAEGAEFHIRLDERMGSHDQIRLPRTQTLQRTATLSHRQATPKKLDPHWQALQEPSQAAVVLFGEELGGGHQSGLKTVLDRPKHCEQSHHSLATTDIALQQAVHRARP